METQAERITKAIEGAGLNASTAARKLGLSPEAVLQWMSGTTKNIRPANLFLLADVTGYEARWIATGEGPAIRAYSTNPHIAHVVEVMEKMPEALREEAAKEVTHLSTSQNAYQNQRATVRTARIYQLQIQLKLPLDYSE